jgi:hypothetical protein
MRLLGLVLTVLLGVFYALYAVIAQSVTTYVSFSMTGATTTTVPITATWADVWVFGAGGGGGSGRRGATGSLRTGGAGGENGTFIRQNIPVSVFGGAGAVVPLLIGSGGTGGAAQTADGADGNNGHIGGNTGLGTVMQIAVGTPGGQPQTNAVVYGTFGGTAQFVEVGASGFIMTSPDGATWTQQTSPTVLNLHGLCASGSILAAVGDDGVIITSSDAAAWTSRTSPTSNQLNACLWDGTDFVAVGNSGTIITAPDPTMAWTANAYSSAANISDVGYDGSSKHVAVDDAGKVITATAATGTWTAAAITPSAAYGLGGVAFGNSTWFAIGTNGVNYTATSPTGTWASQANFGNGAFVRFVNQTFWAAGGGGFGTISYSTDAINWNGVATVDSQGLGGGTALVAYGGGNWVFTRRGLSGATTGAVPYVQACTTCPMPALPYSITAPPGSGGKGGATANATSPGVNNLGIFGNGAGSGPNGSAGGSGQSPGFGVCIGGAGGGGATAANTITVAGFGNQPTAYQIQSIAGPGISGQIAGLGTITGGSGYTNGTYYEVPLVYSGTAAAGLGAVATSITVSGGAVNAIVMPARAGEYFNVNDSLTASATAIGGTGSGFSVPVSTTVNGANPGAGVSTTASQWNWGGSGGGGGAYHPGAAGQAGGTSGNPCSGGAAGAAADNGNNSGAGAAGGNGEIRIIWHYEPQNALSALLLEDGTSILLLEDGSSFCLEGGC